jgi:outer membrane protein OmpA-like peptidoglycan-associated protein
MEFQKFSLPSIGLEGLMKLMRGAIVSSAILLATATSGYAQSWIPNGVYLRGDVGGAFGTDNSFKDTSPTSVSPPSRLGTTTQPGNPGNSIMFGGGVGYRFTPMFRSDFTLDYIPSFKEQTHNSALPALRASAGASSLVGMLNGYLDLNGFAPTMFGPFQPYLDAGVGFAYNDLHKATLSLGGTNIGLLSGSTRTELAWGAGAGVAYSITPNLALDLAYKYLDLGEIRTGTSVTTFGVTGPVTATKANLQAHTVTLGVRWTFGAPPAPPPAPVAAPPAPPPVAVAPQQQMFILFFEFDKSTLTADGKRVVDAAAAAFKSGKSGVAISGYTDLAGTQQYNLALSKRRADIVKSALVRDGVPASAINESWHGKENPRVPTADGVREPQNRRVEISM